MFLNSLCYDGFCKTSEGLVKASENINESIIKASENIKESKHMHTHNSNTIGLVTLVGTSLAIFFDDVNHSRSTKTHFWR